MSTLFVVPTPIGNLEDITFRAVKVLKAVDLILAEDTRVTGKLLKRYDIGTRMTAHHKFNEHKTLQGLIEKLSSGQSIALVSDAGTPGISDPGFLLVRACIENQINVICLPGATAFVTALINSGLPSDRFSFEGFLPIKKGRKSRIEELSHAKKTMIFYESPHRLVKMLEQLAKSFGQERRASVSREMTKIHEETVRGRLSELILHFRAKPVKGELVIVVEGADQV
jgi:16S rRNA (cytidine1402-2'-O)-methyltransferase